MIRSNDRHARRDVIRGGAGALLAALAGCTGGTTGTSTGTATPDPATDADPQTTATEGDEGAGWRSLELTDVRTDESFTVREFAGRPVLLEFFAVWCPVCTRQQQQVGGLVDRMDDLVPISINVDPNEDAARVRSHLEDHDFDWRYAVAPSSMTRALIDEFGTVISNPPAAPVIRVCPDGTASLVEGRGLKSIGDLEAAFDGC
jgi:cytochrome oxidase Cu insertion factor (SCO1/SenC/PrrC family)